MFFKKGLENDKKEPEKKDIQDVEEIGTLVGSVYDYERSNSKSTSIAFFDVYESSRGYTFKNVGRSQGFELGDGCDRTGFDKLKKSLDEQGYVSKAAWLKEREGKINTFDVYAKSMMHSSLLKDFEPLDLDKVALLYQIIKELGYFNIDDLKIIYAIINEYGYKDGVPLIASISTFLTQMTGNIPFEETELGKEHEERGKVYSFQKFSEKKK